MGSPRDKNKLLHLMYRPAFPGFAYAWRNRSSCRRMLLSHVNVIDKYLDGGLRNHSVSSRLFLIRY